MTRKQKQQVAALVQAGGWTLVCSRAPQLVPVPGHPNLREEKPGLYLLERSWRGRAFREGGETLDAALAAAQWQQERIESLNDDGANPSVITAQLSSAER